MVLSRFYPNKSGSNQHQAAISFTTSFMFAQNSKLSFRVIFSPFSLGPSRFHRGVSSISPGISGAFNDFAYEQMEDTACELRRCDRCSVVFFFVRPCERSKVVALFDTVSVNIVNMTSFLDYLRLFLFQQRIRTLSFSGTVGLFFQDGPVTGLRTITVRVPASGQVEFRIFKNWTLWLWDLWEKCWVISQKQEWYAK